MTQLQHFDAKDFNRYLSRGTEKICFVSDKYPGKVLKLSPLSCSTQTVREINYFEYLLRKGVALSFMPKYFGRCSDDAHVGFVQECVSGEHMVAVKYLVRQCYASNLAKLEDALLRFLQEMIDTNVIIMDIGGDNMLIDAVTFRLWVIDGYGTPEFIPLPKYFRWFGRRKIMRQWNKFIRRYTELLEAASKEVGYWVPSRIVSRNGR